MPAVLNLLFIVAFECDKFLIVASISPLTSQQIIAIELVLPGKFGEK